MLLRLNFLDELTAYATKQLMFSKTEDEKHFWRKMLFLYQDLKDEERIKVFGNPADKSIYKGDL